MEYIAVFLYFTDKSNVRILFGLAIRVICKVSPETPVCTLKKERQ